MGLPWNSGMKIFSCLLLTLLGNTMLLIRSLGLKSGDYMLDFVCLWKKIEASHLKVTLSSKLGV